jgi:flagellar basal body-associated protein FliL
MGADAHRDNPPKSGSKLLTLVLVPVVAVAAACGAWLLRGKTDSPPFQAAKVRNVLHLDTFVLNLAGSDERAYLRAGIDLGLHGEPTRKQSEGAPPIALVRDTILGVLSAAKSEDVLTPQGKQALKANLLRALQERIPELGVEEVYFTEFLIQR